MTVATDGTLLIVRRLVNFVYKNYPDKSVTREEIKDIVIRHFAYDTLDYYIKKGEIVAVVRYNFSENGDVADILDLIIKPGENGFRIMKYFIANGWMKFSAARYLRFYRHWKYPGREPRVISLRKFFKKRSN